MPEGKPHRIDLGQRERFPEDGSVGFDIDGSGRDTLFVVAKGQRLYAYRNSCPHLPGSAMAWKTDAYLSPDGAHIVCSGHGARFLPENGLCVQGPCKGERLTPVPLEIDDRSGHVFALIRTTD